MMNSLLNIEGGTCREIPQFTKRVITHYQTLQEEIKLGLYPPTLLQTSKRS